MATSFADQPHVALAYGTSALAPDFQELLAAPRIQRSPADALRDGLMGWRAFMIREAKKELAHHAQVDAALIVRTVDTLWQTFLPTFGKLTVPFFVRTYAEGFRRANAGDVPAEYLEVLARDYARRVGDYFHETSREAMLQGFHTYVNRRVAARNALERSLDAYGLTPRQMSGLTSAAQFETKIESARATSIKAKAVNYIATSLRQRLNTLTAQEEHNLQKQADQTAWLWLYEHDRLSGEAEKVWLTAKDERVCSVCGPLHGQRVPVLEKFEVGDGSLWVPGAHPNCRCEVRLVTPLRLVHKALGGGELEEFNDEHPRDETGRFTAKQRAQSILRQRAEAAPTQFRPIGGDAPPVRERQVIETPVIETYEEPAKVDVVMPQRLDLPGTAGKVSLTGKVSLDKPKVSLGEKVSLDQPKVNIERQQLRATARPSVETPVAFKANVRADTLRAIQAMFTQLRSTPPKLPPVAPQKKKRRALYRPTIKLERPVYAVISPWMLDQHGRIELTSEVEFGLDESAAAYEATELFGAEIESAVEGISYNYDDRIEMTTDDGQQLYAVIPHEEVWDIVATVAYRNSGDPDWTGENTTVTVNWSNDEGDYQFAEKVTYGQIIEMWGLHPDQFDVTVLRLTEGHDSSLGRTTQESYGTRHGHETWTTTGEYNTEQSHIFQIGHSAPIKVLDLIPDVETEDLGDINEGDILG